MNKKIYDELFVPANNMRQVAAESVMEQRVSILRSLAANINYMAKEGKFFTTLIDDWYQPLTDEDWNQLKSRGYSVIFNNENGIVTISWE